MPRFVRGSAHRVVLLLALSGASAGNDLLVPVDDGRVAPVTEIDTWLESVHDRDVDTLLEELGERGEHERVDVRRAAEQTVTRIGAYPARFVRRFAALPAGERADAGPSGLLALHIVRRLGEREDLAAACDVANGIVGPVASPRLRTYLISAAVDVLERDDTADSGYVHRYDDLADELVVTWIDVLRDRKVEGQAPRLAYRLLGRRPQFDDVVLNRLLLLVRKLETPFEDHQLERIRSYLSNRDPACRAAAASVVARLDDPLAIPMLVRLLGDRARIVRGPAHEAVKRLTGMRFGLSAQRWQHWHRAEEAWWASRGENLLGQIRSLDGVSLLDGLNEMAAHALYRRHIGPAVVDLLHHRDPMVVRMTLSVLEATRCVNQAREVYELVSDRRPEVADQAAAVFESLTGRSVRRGRSTVARRRSSLHASPTALAR